MRNAISPRILALLSIISILGPQAALAEEVDTAFPPADISITDGKQFAEPNEELRYKIVVENTVAEERPVTVRVQLPSYLTFVGATDGFTISRRNLEWRGVILPPNGVVEFGIIGTVERDAPDFFDVRVVASAGGRTAVDATTIHLGAAPGGVRINLTDNLQTAAPGEVLEYVVGLENVDELLVTALSISAALPSSAEFVSVSDGGFWNGSNVVWEDLTLSPHGKRTVSMRARVRGDTPPGTILRTSAETRDRGAVDVTEVVSGAPVEEPKTPKQPLLLRKTADRAEVQPGAGMQFHIYLKNVTDRVLRNIVVEDRMDMSVMRVVGGDQGLLKGDMLTWTVAKLQPGESWSARYDVQVSPTARHGTELRNVVTVRGEGLETISLEKRVFTGKVEVVSKLPRTGAGFDTFLIGFITLSSAGQAMWMRKRVK